MFAVPSIYKSFHSFPEAPKSNISSDIRNLLKKTLKRLSPKLKISLDLKDELKEYYNKPKK